MTEPQVMLPVERVVCPIHCEPFRAEWPKGYATTVVELFTAFAADERIIEWASGEADRLELAVAEFGPMCCYVDPAFMVKVYKRARIGTNSLCDSCGKWGRGAPFRAVVGNTDETRDYSHVCFECVNRWAAHA